ncbi:MAG: AraC family transcriptional regulator [Paenibacillus sp.]|nr:AraC family transcriptional regulator [Paenibacillus sp.]
MQYRPRELTPQILFLNAWHNKAQFQLNEDHCDEWMLFIIASGQFRFQIDKHEGIAEKGDLLLCPPTVYLQREMISPASFIVARYNWLSAEGQVVREEQLKPCPVGKISIRDKYRFASTYEYLAMLTWRNDPLALSRRNFLLRDLWEQYEWEWETDRQQTRAVRDDPLMKKAAQMLKESAFEIISLNQLADSLGLSTVQFSRRFRKMFGVNPSEYVSELRIDKARSLLQENKLTLDEIAVLCGYSNGFYFSRVFSQKMRISPSEYRQSYRI